MKSALTNFDRQMRGFIDRAEVVPMRLITRSGLVAGSAVLIDFFDAGYVDLDDLLASSDLSSAVESHSPADRTFSRAGLHPTNRYGLF